MTNTAGRPEQPGPQKIQQPELPDFIDVPVIPEWASNGGDALLGVAALIVLLVAIYIGLTFGAGYGWALLIISACGTLSLWRQDYSRRKEAAELHRERELYKLHQIEAVDSMTWLRFEKDYCVALLEARGYYEVSWIGNRDQNAVDVIATAPDGTKVAVQCKHWKNDVPPDVIIKLSGSVSHGEHQGRIGIVMTNARATPVAHARAREHGITVVDRPVLMQWMSEARTRTEQRGHAPGIQPSAQQRGVRPAALVTAGAIASAIILLLVMVIQGPISHVPAKAAAPKVPRALAPASGPAAVVRKAFTAINRRDWPLLWKLSLHPGSRRGGPAYRNMIAGYRLTARDVITRLKARGNTVTARVLAHETTGTIQTIWFHYTVHDDKIASGYSVVLATSRPQGKAPSVLAQPPNLTVSSLP